MRRLVLALLAAAVLAVPGSPANAIKFTSGELLTGTRVTGILITPTLARQRLDIGIREGGTGTIVVEGDRVNFQSQDFVPKQTVTNVALPDPGTVVLGGLVITGGNDKKVKHKVPWLSKVPLIGDLFRSQTEKTLSNLLIYVTPELVDPEKKPKEIEGYAGAFRIDDAKGNGHVRVIKNFSKYRGSWSWKIKGTWLDGPAAGKTFLAKVKGKIKGDRF